jgi:hypothetical protein
MKKPIVLPLILALCTLLSGCIVDEAITINTTTIIMTTETGDSRGNIIRRTSVRLIA